MTSTAPPTHRDTARSRAFLAAFCPHCDRLVSACPCWTRLDDTTRRRLANEVAARHLAARAAADRCAA